jgi:hypothetical protein
MSHHTDRVIPQISGSDSLLAVTRPLSTFASSIVGDAASGSLARFVIASSTSAA